MATHAAIYRESCRVYHADTCEPLRQAMQGGQVKVHAATHGAYPGTALPAHVLPEVRTIGYWDAACAQDWRLDWHRNEGIEITYLGRGRLDFAVDDQEFRLQPGQLTITRPWQAHRVGGDSIPPSRLYWLILDVGVRRPNQDWRWPAWLVLSDEERKTLTTLLRQNEQPVWPADQQVAACFERVGKLLGDALVPACRTRLVLRINELLLAVLDMLRTHDIHMDPTLTSAQRSVQMFLDELGERLAQPWTVDSMAAACGLGRSRFTHYVRKLANCSPAVALTRWRVQAAERLLRARADMTITDVAMACGFGSSQYFATVFRQVTGRTPREIRLERADDRR
ncbi:MAG: Exoenzyme S synthesis regulatory protein ExsA [Planctomycetes bacterium ADurb.Bin126]|nr:MAG: Exoenzyme S synthesis regulatory protein ExsA [Planctomycetes bacterium ADurb.Bin126]HOD81932.1 AraC family transcriptional regulator [Phycisphaerae bacterium]HQL74147.1 AraC family transcriptional regulator [Phycisphaerae bacterium]